MKGNKTQQWFCFTETDVQAFLGFIAFTSSNRTRCSFTWLDSPKKMQDN